MSKAAIQLVTIAALNLRAGTQFREKLDEGALKDYTELYKEWKEANSTKEVDGKRVKLESVPDMTEWTKCPLPAITVFETEGDDGTINADGFTRISAAKKAGLELIAADVKKGSKADAILYALGANAEHGARLNNADKANKLKAALKIPALAELSNNGLAKKIGVSEFFVRTNRPASSAGTVRVAVSKSGATKKVNTKNIGKKGGNTAKKKAAAKKAAKKGTPAPVAAPSTEGMTAEEAALALAMGGQPGTPEGGTPEGTKFDADTEKALAKIVKVLTDNAVTDGAKLDEDIRKGSIEIPTRDIRAMAQTSDNRICKVYPLVFGDRRMKVAAAFAFIDEIPTPKTRLEHLINMTVANRGIVREQVEGCLVLVIPTGSGSNLSVVENKTLGSILVVPTANKDAAIKALQEA